MVNMVESPQPPPGGAAAVTNNSGIGNLLGGQYWPTLGGAHLDWAKGGTFEE
jgi:hypothetical protein